MIQVSNLTKKYGDNTAVKNLSFNIEKGKIYGFLGPNGAGKSTTMNIITGCLAATEGTVLIDGHDIFEEPIEAKKHIGYLPELPPVYPDMTPNEYLKFVADAKGLNKAEAAEQISHVIQVTGIESVKNRLIKNLSKGYKQRVGIAQAMLGDPDIIILDEPTVGLDPKQIIEIRTLIKSLGENHTVILSSHILPEVAAVCDYVMIIAHGTLVASDTLENLSNYLTGDKNIDVKIKGEDGKIRMMLNEINDIISYEIKPSDEYTNDTKIYDVHISADRDSDIREAIFNGCVAYSLVLLNLAIEIITLEDVFLRLTRDPSEEDNSGLVLNEKLVSEETVYEDGSAVEDANAASDIAESIISHSSDEAEEDDDDDDDDDVLAPKKQDKQDKKDNKGEYKPMFR